MWVWDAELQRLKQDINIAFRERERIENQLSEVAQKRHTADQAAWSVLKKLRKLQTRNNISPGQLASLDEDLKLEQKNLRSIKKSESKLKGELRKVKITFDNLSESYRQRIGLLREIEKRETEAAKKIAICAEVPEESLDDILIVKGEAGIIHVYYGGIGPANGLGHGHHIIDNGVVIYKRAPFRPHGRHNYVKPA